MGIRGPAGSAGTGGGPGEAGAGAGLGCRVEKPHCPTAKPVTTLDDPGRVTELVGRRIALADHVAGHRIGEDFHCVRVGHGVVAHGDAAADLVPEDAQPAGPEAGHRDVPTDGVVFVVAVHRRHERREGTGRRAVDASASAALYDVAGNRGVMDEDAQGARCDDVSFHSLGSGQGGIGLVGIIDAGEVGPLATEDHRGIRSGDDVAGHVQAGRARPRRVVGVGRQEGRPGLDGDVSVDDDGPGIDRTGSGHRHARVGAGGQRARVGAAAGAGHGHWWKYRPRRASPDGQRHGQPGGSDERGQKETAPPSRSGRTAPVRINDHSNPQPPALTGRFSPFQVVPRCFRRNHSNSISAVTG